MSANYGVSARQFIRHTIGNRACAPIPFFQLLRGEHGVEGIFRILIANSSSRNPPPELFNIGQRLRITANKRCAWPPASYAAQHCRRGDSPPQSAHAVEYRPRYPARSPPARDKTGRNGQYGCAGPIGRRNIAKTRFVISAKAHQKRIDMARRGG